MEPNLDNNISTGMSDLSKKKNNNIYIFVSLFVFVLIVILAVFYKQGILFKKKEVVSLPLSPAQQLDLEKRSLLNISTIKINPITQNIPITIDKLPEVLKKFIDQNETGLKIEQVKYEGGLTGYEINYTLKDIKMEEAERIFQVVSINNKFEMLEGLRKENFGFAEYKNAKYKIKVSYTLNEDKTIAININIINSQ